MDSDEEDFVFIGTPIEREEDFSSTRKKKALAEASSQLRTLPAWKQEVRDEEGRRRFHGAFTGGFSAGFYNTVGSKEGWAPQSFSSSRKSRTEFKKQSVLDFLDDDEKTEMEGHLLGTASQFDTFGFTAAELARKHVEKEQKQRPSAIPGPVPDELVAPAAESIGVKLLLKMGWRHGRSIEDSSVNALQEVRREARKAFLALSTNDKTANFNDSEPTEVLSDRPVNDDQSSQRTPVYVRQPKQDLYGLGYDPYKHAPEFREMKRSRLSMNKDIDLRKPFSSRNDSVASKSGKVAPGFGIGAMEEHDVEDEDIYASGYDYAETYIPHDDEHSRLALEDMQKPVGEDLGFVLRFRIGSKSDYQMERFDPPIIPKSFVARHKFPGPLNTNSLISEPPPPEVPPPEDKNLRVMIEGVATLVARCGKLFEDISREKNKSNALFDFLNGGSGCGYYARKLWEEQQKRTDQFKWPPDENLCSTVQKMTAESRGKLLGERPLEKSSKGSSSSVTVSDNVNVQSNLSDTFKKPEAFKEILETAKPFKDDPAKQERFEQFLKDKYQGGLRSTAYSKAINMTDDSRAREKLDFEAAADAITKAKSTNQANLSAHQLMDITMSTGLQFTSGGIEHGKTNSVEQLVSIQLHPKREEFEWRPAPLLCKRFDLVDPYMGKPAPAPRMRSKLDSLFFTPDSTKMTKSDNPVISSDQPPLPSKSNEDMAVEMSNMEPDIVPEVENIERPVDLYKAIFSDESDEEEEGVGIKSQKEDPQKKTEAASAALSRLVAGDFLESLGKELGLEVPPDLPPPATTTTTATPGASASVKNVSEETEQSKILKQKVANEDDVRKIPPTSEHTFAVPNSKKTSSDVAIGKEDTSDRKEGYNSGNSSSEDKRSRKRHRRHRRRHSSSEDDSSSDDSRDRHRSKSKGDRRSSRRKHRSKRRSKHR